jgi:energy-coupling factor transport system permease protein
MANIQCPGYHLGDSSLHAAKTRSKVLLVLVFISASGTGGGFVLLTIALLCHLGMLISGISVLDAWKRLVALKTFLLVLGGIPLFFTPGIPIQLFDGFVLPVTREGFECSVFTISRLVLMIWVSMILIWTTSPESLMRTVTGLGSRLYPESKVLQEFVLVGVLAFQALPYLLAEAEEEIGKGWKKRGKAEFETPAPPQEQIPAKLYFQDKALILIR